MGQPVVFEVGVVFRKTPEWLFPGDLWARKNSIPDPRDTGALSGSLGGLNT